MFLTRTIKLMVGLLCASIFLSIAPYAINTGSVRADMV